MNDCEAKIMVLTFDIGNSNIVFAGVENGVSMFSCSISTSTPRTADEYAVLLKQLSELRGVNLKCAEGAIIASVVPQQTSLLREAIQLISGKKALVVGPGVKTGLNIKIEDASELGGDFVAAAIAALERYPLPCVTIDMGMATALGVIDRNGNYIGGAIAPGVILSHNALIGGASKLPSVAPEAPAKVIGKTTENSVRSGVVFGAAALLDGLLVRIEDELGERVTAIATGELANSVIPYCRRKDIINDPDLIARGLWLIYKKNVKI